MKRDPQAPPRPSAKPVVALRYPRCPTCRTRSRKPERTLDSSDEHAVQLRKCSACGLAFVVVYD